MRSILQAIAAGCAVLFCASAAAPERIDYTLTPVLRDGALTAVEVDIRFRGEADGETELHLPDSWGGQDELWRSIDALGAVSGATMRAGETQHQRVLTHRPNARIHVRYRIIQDWEGAPRAEFGNTYRPVIQPGYFHLIGSAFLVRPVAAAEEARVRVRVRNLPRGWRYASDLEHPDVRLENVQSSVLVAGDFRILHDPQTNVRVAIRGEWSFNDADFMNDVSRIIDSQRTFWSDPPSPYLVTVLELAGPEGWISIGGTGLGDAFAFFATPTGPADGITRTLAHESLHTWLPAQVGGMPEEGEAIAYWLSEGFTSFYTPRLLVRDSLFTPAQFAAELNEMLRAYARSPVRTEPNARILADFWTDRDMHQLPYQRGRLLALIWDRRLRAAGHDFDDVVIAMRARARNGERYATDVFAGVARDFRLDLDADIETYVNQGAPILLPEDLLAPCGRIATSDVANFHRGFDIAATQANNNVIVGVDPTLPAYAAGMRNGMTLVRRDAGEIGDSEQEIAYVVRDSETERTLRYMPRGHGSLTRQRLELDKDLTGDRLAACVSVLGGG